MMMVSFFLACWTAERSVPAAPLSALLVTYSVEGTQRSSSPSRRGRKLCPRGDAGFEKPVRPDRDFQKRNTDVDHITYLLYDLVCDRITGQASRRAD